MQAAAPVSVEIVGTGPRAVVLSNQSDEDLCSWLPLTKILIHKGFRVALYDYAYTPSVDLTAVAKYLRRRGATGLALVGASEGAKTSILVGSELTPPPDAVVSLSAEAALLRVPIAPYAKKLRSPTLYVTAARDGYGSTAATKGYYQSSSATSKRLIVVPGDAHGTALLDKKVTLAVTRFLESHDH